MPEIRIIFQKENILCRKYENISFAENISGRTYLFPEIFQATDTDFRSLSPLCLLLLTHFGDTTEAEILFPPYIGITRRNMKKKIVIFFYKKKRFSAAEAPPLVPGVFHQFLGQRPL